MIDQTVQFLTAEESAEVDQALLSSPEKFLARLTISTAKLIQRISQDLDTPVEALTARQIVTWFEQDARVKREQGVNAAVLKWQPDNLDDLT